MKRWPCGIRNILQGKHVLNCLEAQCNTVYLHVMIYRSSPVSLLLLHLVSMSACSGKTVGLPVCRKCGLCL